MSIRTLLRITTLEYGVLLLLVAWPTLRSLSEPRFGDLPPDYALPMFVAALAAYVVGLCWMWRIAGSSVDEA